MQNEKLAKGPSSQPRDHSILVAHLRPSRRRARSTALAEVCALLRGLECAHAVGGPLSEVGGIYWVQLPTSNLSRALPRLKRLGYTEAIDLVRPLSEGPPTGSSWPQLRWKGKPVELVRVYEEPESAFRDQAPDRRTFLLECGDGIVRPIVGYRGGKGPLEHRALPVVDARLLVNLVFSPMLGLFLDPFAGAGGVVIEAAAGGWFTVSLDIDPTLRYGLKSLANEHVVASATALPFANETFDAIASEPPYHTEARDILTAAIGEFARVLRPGARLALLVASDQADIVLNKAGALNLELELASSIDRKGTAVTCLCWKRTKDATTASLS